MWTRPPTHKLRGRTSTLTLHKQKGMGDKNKKNELKNKNDRIKIISYLWNYQQNGKYFFSPVKKVGADTQIQ